MSKSTVQFQQHLTRHKGNRITYLSLLLNRSRIQRYSFFNTTSKGNNSTFSTSFLVTKHLTGSNTRKLLQYTRGRIASTILTIMMTLLTYLPFHIILISIHHWKLNLLISANQQRSHYIWQKLFKFNPSYCLRNASTCWQHIVKSTIITVVGAGVLHTIQQTVKTILQ